MPPAPPRLLLAGSFGRAIVRGNRSSIEPLRLLVREFGSTHLSLYVAGGLEGDAGWVSDYDLIVIGGPAEPGEAEGLARLVELAHAARVLVFAVEDGRVAPIEKWPAKADGHTCAGRCR